MVALTDRSTSNCSTSSEVMPVQEFALDSAGTERVQIFQESSGEGVPGYWASDTGLVLTLDGASSPLTVLSPQADNWDKDGFVKCCDQQTTTMTSTLTIPSAIGGPKQRSLSGTLAGMIVYPVEGPAAGLAPFGTYKDQTLNVSIPVHLQLVS
jgi:hypothetical protein